MAIPAGYWNFSTGEEQSTRLLIRQASAPPQSPHRDYYEGYLDTTPVELEVDPLTGHVVMLVEAPGPYRLTQRTITIYIGSVMSANQQVMAGTFGPSTISVMISVCRGLSTPPLQYWVATYRGPEIPPEPTSDAQGQ